MQPGPEQIVPGKAMFRRIDSSFVRSVCRQVIQCVMNATGTSAWFDAPMLYALAFIGLFTIGGLRSVSEANVMLSHDHLLRRLHVNLRQMVLPRMIQGMIQGAAGRLHQSFALGRMCVNDCSYVFEARAHLDGRAESRG